MTRNATWKCHEVLIKDMSTGTTYTIPVRDTFMLNDEPKDFKCKSTKESLVNLTRQLKNVNYEVNVYTGNEKSAGTS